MGTKHQKMKPFSDTNSSNRRENISTPIANRIAEIRYQLITTFYQMQTIKNIRNQSTTEDSKMYFDIKMFELENAIMILQKRHEKFQSNVASLVDYVKNCTTKTNSHFEKNELLTDDKSPIKEYLRKESPNFSSLPVSCEYETTKNYDNKNNFKLQSKLGEDVKTFGDHFFNKEIFEAKKQTYPYHFSTPTVMMLNISKQGKGSSFLKSKLKEKATDYRKTKDDSKKATKNDKKKPSSNEGDKSKNKTKETSKFTEKEVKNPLDAELSISEIKQILIEEGFEEQITRAYETTGKQMEILDASEQKTEEHSQENGEKTQITDKLSICTPVFQTKVNKQENEPHNTDNQHQSEIPAVVNKPDIKKANATNDRNLLITNLLNEEKSDEKIEIVKPQIIRTRSSWFFSVESGTSVKSKWSNLTQNKCVHKLQIKDNTSVLSLDKTITQKLNTVSSVSNEKIENTLETKRSHTSRSRSLSKISMYSASANVKKANTISNKTVQEDLCKPKIVTCPNLKRPPNFFTKKRSQSEKSRPVNTNNKPVKTRESDGKRSNTVNITEYRQNKSSALKASHTAAKLAQADKRRAREMAVESDDGTIASGLEYSNKSKNITQKGNRQFFSNIQTNNKLGIKKSISEQAIPIKANFVVRKENQHKNNHVKLEEKMRQVDDSPKEHLLKVNKASIKSRSNSPKCSQLKMCTNQVVSTINQKPLNVEIKDFSRPVTKQGTRNKLSLETTIGAFIRPTIKNNSEKKQVPVRKINNISRKRTVENQLKRKQLPPNKTKKEVDRDKRLLDKNKCEQNINVTETTETNQKKLDTDTEANSKAVDYEHECESEYIRKKLIIRQKYSNQNIINKIENFNDNIICSNGQEESPWVYHSCQSTNTLFNDNKRCISSTCSSPLFEERKNVPNVQEGQQTIDKVENFHDTISPIICSKPPEESEVHRSYNPTCTLFNDKKSDISSAYNGLLPEEKKSVANVQQGQQTVDNIQVVNKIEKFIDTISPIICSNGQEESPRVHHSRHPTNALFNDKKSDISFTCSGLLPEGKKSVANIHQDQQTIEIIQTVNTNENYKNPSNKTNGNHNQLMCFDFDDENDNKNLGVVGIDKIKPNRYCNKTENSEITDCCNNNYKESTNFKDDKPEHNSKTLNLIESQRNICRENIDFCDEQFLFTCSAVNVTKPVINKRKYNQSFVMHHSDKMTSTNFQLCSQSWMEISSEKVIAVSNYEHIKSSTGIQKEKSEENMYETTPINITELKTSTKQSPKIKTTINHFRADLKFCPKVHMREKNLAEKKCNQQKNKQNKIGLEKADNRLLEKYKSHNLNDTDCRNQPNIENLLKTHEVKAESNETIKLDVHQSLCPTDLCFVFTPDPIFDPKASINQPQTTNLRKSEEQKTNTIVKSQTITNDEKSYYQVLRRTATTNIASKFNSLSEKNTVICVYRMKSGNKRKNSWTSDVDDKIKARSRQRKKKKKQKKHTSHTTLNRPLGSRKIGNSTKPMTVIEKVMKIVEKLNSVVAIVDLSKPKSNEGTSFGHNTDLLPEESNRVAKREKGIVTNVDNHELESQKEPSKDNVVTQVPENNLFSESVQGMTPSLFLEGNIDLLTTAPHHFGNYSLQNNYYHDLGRESSFRKCTRSKHSSFDCINTLTRKEKSIQTSNVMFNTVNDTFAFRNYISSPAIVMTNVTKRQSNKTEHDELEALLNKLQEKTEMKLAESRQKGTVNVQMNEVPEKEKSENFVNINDRIIDCSYTNDFELYQAFPGKRKSMGSRGKIDDNDRLNYKRTLCEVATTTEQPNYKRSKITSNFSFSTDEHLNDKKSIINRSAESKKSIKINDSVDYILVYNKNSSKNLSPEIRLLRRRNRNGSKNSNGNSTFHNGEHVCQCPDQNSAKGHKHLGINNIELTETNTTGMPATNRVKKSKYISSLIMPISKHEKNIQTIIISNNKLENVPVRKHHHASQEIDPQKIDMSIGTVDTKNSESILQNHLSTERSSNEYFKGKCKFKLSDTENNSERKNNFYFRPNDHLLKPEKDRGYLPESQAETRNAVVKNIPNLLNDRDATKYLTSYLKSVKKILGLYATSKGANNLQHFDPENEDETSIPTKDHERTLDNPNMKKTFPNIMTTEEIDSFTTACSSSSDNKSGSANTSSSHYEKEEDKDGRSEEICSNSISEFDETKDYSSHSENGKSSTDKLGVRLLISSSNKTITLKVCSTSSQKSSKSYLNKKSVQIQKDRSE